MSQSEQGQGTRQSHTPGPWESDKGRVPGVTGGGVSICQCCATNGAYEEADANAHLIAAAPEMLEALRGVTNLIRGYDPSLDTYADSLDSLIANAEGRDAP